MNAHLTSKLAFHCLLVSWLLGSPACSTIDRAVSPRPALPLPAPIAARYALPAVIEEAAMAPVGEVHDAEFFRGSLRCGSEEIDFYYIRPKRKGPHPFLLMLPILGGGEELLWWLAGGLVPEGYAVGWTRRVGSPLRPGQAAGDLETMFRRTVVQNRAFLKWARQQPEVDAARTFLLGLSTGGIVGGVLAATEPDLKGVVLALAGGDLSELLVVSTERRAVTWRDFRRRSDGVASLELRREIATDLVSDPARFGPYLETSKVLLVTARFDGVVPARNQQILWESLGRPQWVKLPFGHYTAIIGLESVIRRIRDFFAPMAGLPLSIGREALPAPDVTLAMRLAQDHRRGSDAAPSFRPLPPD